MTTETNTTTTLDECESLLDLIGQARTNTEELFGDEMPPKARRMYAKLVDAEDYASQIVSQTRRDELKAKREAAKVRAAE